MSRAQVAARLLISSGDNSCSCPGNKSEIHRSFNVKFVLCAVLCLFVADLKSTLFVTTMVHGLVKVALHRGN